MIVPGSRPLWKPGVGAQIDRGSPAAIRLKACWLFNEDGGYGAYDLAGSYHFALSTAGVTRVADTGGPGIKFNGTTGQGIAPGHPLAGATAFTIIAQIRQKNGLASPFGPYLGSDQSFTGGVYFASNQLSTSQVIVSSTTLSFAVLNDTWMTVAITWSAATQVIRSYLNGIQNGTATVTAPIASIPAYTQTYIGKASAAASNLLTDSGMYIMKVYDRTLSPADIAADYASPYAMLQPVNQRRWLAVASAPPPSGNNFNNILNTTIAPSSNRGPVMTHNPTGGF